MKVVVDDDDVAAAFADEDDDIYMFLFFSARVAQPKSEIRKSHVTTHTIGTIYKG